MSKLIEIEFPRLMRAFHNSKEIKKKYVDRVIGHIEADEVIKGKYWENGKGCAIGCTIHGSNHQDYEAELGIPTWLAQLEDRLFEGMSNDRAKTWPKRFLESIAPGVDLERAKAPFLIFVLESMLKTFDNKKNPEVTKTIKDIIRLYQKGGTPEQFEAARNAALAAVDTGVHYTTDNAAYMVAIAVALTPSDIARATYAATYAARAASLTTYAAVQAARAAAHATHAPCAAAYATDVASMKTYDKLANKLLMILKGIK